MNRVPVCVAAAAVLMVMGGAIAIAGKPAAPERVMIVPDQQAGAVRFVIDGEEQARLDATGLHVRAGISYGGALTNYGAAGFDAHGAESVGAAMPGKGLPALLALFLLASPVAFAAEPQPGAACSPNESFTRTGGQENPGSGHFMVCAGGVWVNFIDYLSASGYVGVKKAVPAAPLHVGGEAIIGTTTGLACSSTTTGGLRWSSANLTFEMCDGTSWRKFIADSSSGQTSTPPSGTGYFVMSNGTWNGNLAGLAGANDKCLSDLSINTWLNKSDALNRGLLNGSHVQAFVCDTNTCNQVTASATYTFAASGSATTGGTTFTADSNSRGPGNAQNWSGTNYFGGNVNYLTARCAANETNTLWGTTTCNNGNNTCSGLTASNAIAVAFGNSNYTDVNRYEVPGGLPCSSSFHVICMAHPGNETATSLGYFVMSSGTWNGNLGGLSGADSKCLTDLTNNDWMGKTDASNRGLVNSTHVRALLCDSVGQICRTGTASQPYAYAVSGDTSKGGGIFTVNSSGYGPGYLAAWSGTTAFGGAYEYWTGIWAGNSSNAPWDDTLWTRGAFYCGSGNHSNGCSGTGSAWTSSSSSVRATTGLSSATDRSRWNKNNTGGDCSDEGNHATCDQALHLICMVNP